MKSTTRKLLRWWHIIFGVVASFFALQYLQDGLSNGGESGDIIKGCVWVAMALFMIVPELVAKHAKNGE